MPKKDFSQIAFAIVQQATGVAAPDSKPVIGRAGGLKGGKARANALTKKQRSEIAKIAAAARWKRSVD